MRVISSQALLDFAARRLHAQGVDALPEVGSQGVVSEVLRGKRDLNLRQIRALGQRFGVPPSVFVEAVA